MPCISNNHTQDSLACSLMMNKSDPIRNPFHRRIRRDSPELRTKILQDALDLLDSFGNKEESSPEDEDN